MPSSNPKVVGLNSVVHQCIFPFEKCICANQYSQSVKGNIVRKAVFGRACTKDAFWRHTSIHSPHWCEGTSDTSRSSILYQPIFFYGTKIFSCEISPQAILKVARSASQTYLWNIAIWSSVAREGLESGTMDPRIFRFVISMFDTLLYLVIQTQGT